MERLTRTLAAIFLRSTARGSLTEALPEGVETPFGRFLKFLQIDKKFSLVGRFVGFFLTASMKARIQESLINRYRIPVTFHPEAKLQEHLEKAWSSLVESDSSESLGDYLEFGVYQGNSMLCSHRALESLDLEGVRMFGFDSFEGLPDVEEIGEVWSAGQFRSDIEMTEERLTEGGIDWGRTRLVKGFFSDTLNQDCLDMHAIEKASLIMIDSDLYSSAKEALEFCEPLIRDEAVIFFDDWLSTDKIHGEQLAFREFMEANPELSAVEFGAYHEQSRVFRLQRSTAKRDQAAVTE
jgi:O-methyltransferase